MISLNILLSILLIAVFYDVRTNRVPNWLILAGLFLGYFLHASILGIRGVEIAFLGMTTGFTILMPIYVIGGMGAGDVKLMSVVGLFLGSAQNVLVAGAATLISGGILGVTWILVNKGGALTISRYISMLKCFLVTGNVSYVESSDKETASMKFPYATAIATGTLITLWLMNNCSHAYRGILA